MIIIALREGDDGMTATVNAVDTQGEKPKTFDVSEHYTVKELLVTNEDGTSMAGWFVGKPCETPVAEWQNG